jgi:hypothetical protein
VVKVLDAVRTAGVEAPNLLSAQQDSSEPGTFVPLKVLEVLVGPPLPSGSEAIAVQVLNSGQRSPTLKINNGHVPLATLRSTLRQLFQNQSERLVLETSNSFLTSRDALSSLDSSNVKR